MDASIPVFGKPHPNLSVLDWTRNIQRLQHEARSRRSEAFGLRKSASCLRNEAAVTTVWDNELNTQLLRDRIFEVESWREKQRFTRECVRDETRALSEEKRATELMLEWTQVPLMVTSQCFNNREQRVPQELTRDQLGEELKNELHIIENSKRVLTDLCHMGWEKLKELNNVFCRLEREIKNKDETINLDTHVKELNRNSANISFKIDPTRIPNGTMSEESHVFSIENTIKIAEQLMSESKNLREKMFRGREQARNQMYVQSQTVEMVMRRRIYDIQRARNEMEWQKHKLESQLDKLDKEIVTLREAVADKIDPTKLVETRLELRTLRPEMELVNDKPMRGLIEEFERVHTSKHLLDNKLEEALKTHHAMQNHLQRVNKELQLKNQALETDRRLIEIRKPIGRPDETDLERSVGYCHVDKEMVRKW